MSSQTGLIKYLSVVGMIVAASVSEASMMTIDFEGIAPDDGKVTVMNQNYVFGDYNVSVTQATFVDAGFPDPTYASDGSDYLYISKSFGFIVTRTDNAAFDAISIMGSEFRSSFVQGQSFNAIGIGPDGFAFQQFDSDDTFGFETFAFDSTFRNLTSLQIVDTDGKFGWDNLVLQPTVVPEPASLALFGLGGLGLAVAARRRKRVSQN
ncbi:PEP-CTERM sorting domain-containing protein [Blastopirellula marina]|uniref:Ice-binding protein C-terminal domain-containing protein n=1 Tax=Blastopirellula marina TaxID=124 RepID=A0A2S8GDA3_9BACT|nr:PEP-CTERM sorting domain-containing protein [Blastopirellula marina]PQO42403.1 hypothetical protein C5Y93_29170 [Blastopirellula marina]